MAPKLASSLRGKNALPLHAVRGRFFTPRSMGAILLSTFAFSGSSLSAADYYLGSNGTNLEWNATSPIWRIDNQGAGVAWDASQSTHSAINQTSGASTLLLSESLTMASIVQSGAASTSIGAQSPNTILTLSGSGEKLTVNNARIIQFLDSIQLALEPTAATDLVTFNTGGGYLGVDGTLRGSVGSLVGSTVTGGLEKTGTGTLYLNGNNTYSGYTRLKAGVLEVGSSTALGTSTLLFEGGTLRYKAGVTTDFSSAFHTATTGTTHTGPIKIDTNGNNVTLETALAGTSQGLVKLGAGTLQLTSGNKISGPIEVRAGVLKGSPIGFDVFSNVVGTKITVFDGATLDINNASPSPHNFVARKYELEIQGEGVVDQTKVGGRAGAVTNSGSLSNIKVFESIKLLGDTTLSGGRWDLGNINAQGFTIRKVGGDVAWVAGTKTGVHDIIIDQGHFYTDNTDLGDSSYTVFINANVQPSTGSTVNGRIQNYNNATINKQIRLNGGDISSSGANTVVSTYTFSEISTVTLASNPLRDNILTSVTHYKDLAFKGKMTGSGGITVNMSNVTNGTNSARYSVTSLLNSGNDFTGTIKLNKGVLRLSDGTLNGTLGAATNTISFTAGANSGAVGSSTDQHTFLDLFGTNQAIGALNGTQASHHVINNRAGSSSTLSLGNGNAHGAFAGNLRDSYELPNTALAQEGITGILNLTKTGTGTQILSGANLYSGLTRVEAGTLLVRNSTGSATGSSSLFAVAGSGARVGGNGSITGGNSKSITLGTGTFLMVGNSHQSSTFHSAAALDTAAQTLSLGSSQNVDLTLSGTLQIDLFNKNSSDLLLLASLGGDVLLDGLIEVGLSSNAVTSNWAIGDRWKIVDWSGLTGGATLTQDLQLQTTTLAGFQLTTLVENQAMYLQLAAIPEPSRVVLLLGGALGMLCYRRRQ